MKRFLSIILAAVMVIALLPSAFATTETGKTVYKYEFTLAGAGETENTAIQASEVLNDIDSLRVPYGELTTIGNDADEPGYDWAYVNARGLFETDGDSNYKYYSQFTTDGFWSYAASSSMPKGKNGVVFRINVPEAGKYIPTINYMPYKANDLYAYIIDDSVNGKKYSSRTYNFEGDETTTYNSTSYMVDTIAEGSTKVMPTEAKLIISGQVETSDSVQTVDNLAVMTGSPVELEAGTNYLFLAYGSATRSWFPYINSFELEKVPVTKYEFTLGAMGTTGTYTNSVTDTTNLHAEQGMGGGNWTYVGEHAYTTNEAEEDPEKKDNFYGQFTPYGFWYYSASSSGALGYNGVVFEIDVPADGEYITTLNYLPSYAGGTVYACIIDKAIDGRSHTNGYPYDFCDTVSDVVSISGSTSYAENALKASLTGEKDLRSEITLALSGELQYTNTANVTDATVAEIKANEPVALKAGKYYLMIANDGIKTEHTASSKFTPYINSFEIEKVGELDTALDAAFTVTETPLTDYVAPSVTGITLNGQTIESTQNSDGSYNLTAPATNDEKKSFLYWAMGLVGNKRIVSFSETLENYIPEGNYKTYLVPVYKGDVSTTEKEFYNQNGQLIPDATEDTTVSMPGYGSTNKWKQYEDTNIYVADYEKTAEQRDSVTVTVNDVDKEVLYGTSVTCTASAEDANGAPFKCWTKTDINGETEIVSVDKTYTFRAWENCTVTAVYEEHSFVSVVRKIITDSFAAGSETGIMAEFIGFDNKVVEKGILFGENRIAMTAPGSQFSVLADKAGKYKGYAIVKNTDGTYSLITGNEITVSDAE